MRIPKTVPRTLLRSSVDGGVGDWQALGECNRRGDPEAFFPKNGKSSKEATEVCGVCLVRAECLGYALENCEDFGIWGGLSERERRKLMKGRVRA